MEAEDCGELEARAFDLRLRALESREREDRLTRLLVEHPDLAASPALPYSGIAGVDASEIERLRREVGQLSDYHQALLRSKGWRLVQTLRRPLGRAW